MVKQVQVNLKPSQAADEEEVIRIAGSLAAVSFSEIKGIRILKRSVDARKSDIRIKMTIDVITGDDPLKLPLNPYNPRDVSLQPEVIVVGAGPAGLFASLRLIELGLRPVILERGKKVSSRKKDIASITRKQEVNPESNYCFGEGGAGTFSDGKLYTRSKKRGDNSRVLELLCLNGADENILYEAQPHIGTDKLPRIITNIRNSITEAGGIFLTEKKVTDLIIEGNTIKGVFTSGNEKHVSSQVILATGHSARDIYEMCSRRNIDIQLKSFAMGIRVEHPQEMIDRIQYHGNRRGEYLPAATYSLARQIGGRGVYSFCMCPGGFIVPSATGPEEVVVNGMSPSGRNSPYANSGIVVEIRPDDLDNYLAFGELSGLMFQKFLENEAWKYGGKTQRAPAQRLADFVSGKYSSTLPKVSYFPGVTSSPLHEWLPEMIRKRLQEGFRQFGTALKGFLTNDAVILGVESRTSSPVRILRDNLTMQHIRVKGLYPCGEGSGYAGGIVSSAIDGIRCAEAIFSERNKIS
jgi:uncharacterized FAD-dependent dehydrogenase